MRLERGMGRCSIASLHIVLDAYGEFFGKNRIFEQWLQMLSSSEKLEDRFGAINLAIKYRYEPDWVATELGKTSPARIKWNTASALFTCFWHEANYVETLLRRWNPSPEQVSHV